MLQIKKVMRASIILLIIGIIVSFLPSIYRGVPQSANKAIEDGGGQRVRSSIEQLHRNVSDLYDSSQDDDMLFVKEEVESLMKETDSYIQAINTSAIEKNIYPVAGLSISLIGALMLSWCIGRKPCKKIEGVSKTSLKSE